MCITMKLEKKTRHHDLKQKNKTRRKTNMLYNVYLSKYMYEYLTKFNAQFYPVQCDLIKVLTLNSE